MSEHLSQLVRRLRGWLWMMRHFGVRRTLAYRHALNEDWRMDYSKIFTPDELALLGEQFVPAPWEAE